VQGKAGSHIPFPILKESERPVPGVEAFGTGFINILLVFFKGICYNQHKAGKAGSHIPFPILKFHLSNALCVRKL